ncbi:methyltransferase domain-containing protein [Dictyobacter aurantiacus]|uniref:Methyltransferase domain-containing protein n=1 Tax=Dictyobacter aurantiacus TaxID=1936993 RepID=A0A401ZQG9_9CHLR|nr:class I SAM-dependent methyltransferase [Dictyobacter aurantiacus]GCE09117.1 hypothetical protein KDAU_64460 [Dictyobacter aurantiacus]
MSINWETTTPCTEQITLDLINALLKAEPLAILHFGHMYSLINDLDPISATQMEQYLTIQPLYLGNVSDGKWGMASEDARRCLYDIRRTQAFILGIICCIRELQLELGRRNIYVVEAGGGTGILAIAAALAGADVVLLEINEETAHRASKFINSLSLSEKIKVICTDATIYIPERKFDVIISECLHTGVVKEPQIQIMQHLGRYLNPNGKFLPEGVYLSWVLADTDWTGIESDHIELSKIEKKIRSIGQWSQSPYLNFQIESMKENIGKIMFIVPLHTGSSNSVIAAMDITIYTPKSFVQPITLISGEAAFLGQPHIWKLNTAINSEDGSYAFGYFTPGGTFPKVIYRIL